MVLGDDRWSWRRFADAVDACARALLAAGIGRGDRVAALATPRPEALVSFLATARIGAIWSGLNLKQTRDELLYVVGDSEPSLLIAIPEFRERDYRPDLAALAAAVPSLRGVVLLGAEWDAFLASGSATSDAALAAAIDPVRPEDPALLIYTSGSTGRPKGAMLSHRGLVRCLRYQSDFWWAEPLRVLNNMPISNMFCIGDLFCWTMIGGGTTIFNERFDPREVLATIQREKVTVWGQVPTMQQLALALPDAESFDLSSLQLIFWAGARAPRELIRKLATLAPRLSTNYGLTETVAGVTYVVPGADFDTLAETAGTPHPTYEIRIVASDGTVLGTGVEGEIQVRGDCTMLGYWRRPEATAAMLGADGWLRTGDIGLIRPDGNLQIAGRLSDMFKSGGFNVYPREIELALEAHPAVAIAAVIGVPDGLYGEVGWAYVLPEPDAEPDATALTAWCRERLANYKVPKRIAIRRDLPLVAVGKIDKSELRRAAKAQLEGAQQ
jgi:fatty-acyl-CoA synthase